MNESRGLIPVDVAEEAARAWGVGGGGGGEGPVEDGEGEDLGGSGVRGVVAL